MSDVFGNSAATPKVPRIRIPRAAPRTSRIPVTGSDGKELLNSAMQIAKFIGGFANQQKELDDTTQATLAVEKAKRDYTDFLKTLQKNKDYTNYTRYLEDWQTETSSKYLTELESKGAQDLFTKKFSEFYTQSYAGVAQLGMDRTISDAQSMITHLSDIAQKEGTPLAISNLENFLFGELSYAPDGTSVREGGAIRLGATDEAAGKTTYKNAIHGAYKTKTYDALMRIAEKNSFQYSLDYLNETDEAGNYVNFKSLSGEERGLVGELLQKEFGDRTRMQDTLLKKRQEAVYKEVSDKFFKIDENGLRGITQVQLQQDYKHRMNADDYVRVNQWFEDMSKTRPGEMNAYDYSILASVETMIMNGDDVQRISAFIADNVVGTDAAGNEVGMSAPGYIAVVNANESRQGRRHDMKDSDEAISSALEGAGEAVVREAQDLARSVIIGGRMRNGQYLPPEEWTLSDQEKSESIDAIITTYSRQIMGQAMQDNFQAIIPGISGKKYSGRKVVDDKGEEVKLSGQEMFARDVQTIDAYEQYIKALGENVYPFMSDSQRQQTKKVTDNLTSYYDAQLQDPETIRNLRSSGLLPTGGNARKWAVKNVVRSKLSGLPVYKMMYDGKDEKAPVYLTITWNEASNSEIWAEWNPKEEERIMKEIGLEYFTYVDEEGAVVQPWNYYPQESARSSVYGEFHSK